jgi:glycosyltransferase involved in cell wall biosynthesis
MTAIVMVSGSWPPEVCGVGDYAERLSRELEHNAVAVRRFASSKLSTLLSPETIDRIETIDSGLIHIQYPTAGYGRSLIPAMLAKRVRRKPVVVTLHEYSVFRWYRRAWFSSFARHCAARIFTTEEERDLFAHRFPDRNGIDLTIEIGSNIPAGPAIARVPGKVSYFGLIAPNKGIEQFLDLCEIAGSAATGLSFDLIGAVPDRHRRYADMMLRRAAACGVHISLHLPDDAVAERLAASTFAYLPFPDGASAKRGTLAAAIVNGLVVVTRHSSITPDWIRSATVAAEAPFDALRALTRLQNDDPWRSAMADRAAQAAARFRWDTIAQRHSDLYRQLAARDSTDARRMTDTKYESRLAS